MSHGEHGGAQLRPLKHRGVLMALAAALAASACAQSSEGPMQGLAQRSEPPPERQGVAQARSELDRAIIYWGQQYAKSPQDKKAAISYARNLKAAGQKEKALAVLQQASLYHGNDRELASEYGRLALEFDQVSLAHRLLAIADDPANPDWRVISAQGTVLAKQGDYKGAIPYYERALRLAPDQPSVINNLAMAHAAEGQPAKAEPLLRRAVASGSAPAKVHQNLALVLSLQGRHDEARQLAQSSPAGDATASDVDYLRRMVRIEQKAAGPALAADRPASGLRAAAAESQDSGGGSIDWDTRVAAASPTLVLKQSQR